jgi:hypothetical protein
LAADLGPLIVTGSFTLGGVVAGSVLTQVFQLSRDRKIDKRAVRDRRANRLRENYSALLLTVMDREARAQRWRWDPHDFQRDATDQRQNRIDRLMAEARIDIDTTQVALTLESEKYGSEVLEIFRTFNDALTDTFSQVMSNIMDSTPEPLGPYYQRLREARTKLIDIGRYHLAEHEKSV